MKCDCACERDLGVLIEDLEKPDEDWVLLCIRGSSKDVKPRPGQMDRAWAPDSI